MKTVENQPRLHAGETVGLHFYNDDDEVHEIFVTTNASADPERSNTSTEDALARAGPVTSNRSASGGEFTIPEDAEALYLWCWIDEHEAEGEVLRVPLQPAHEDGDETEAIPASGPALLLALGVGLALRRRM